MNLIIEMECCNNTLCKQVSRYQMKDGLIFFWQITIGALNRNFEITIRNRFEFWGKRMACIQRLILWNVWVSRGNVGSGSERGLMSNET